MYTSDLIEELQKMKLKYHPASVYNNGSSIEIVRD